MGQAFYKRWRQVSACSQIYYKISRRYIDSHHSLQAGNVSSDLNDIIAKCRLSGCLKEMSLLYSILNAFLIVHNELRTMYKYYDEILDVIQQLPPETVQVSGALCFPLFLLYNNNKYLH